MLSITDPLLQEPPVTRKFPSQGVSSPENIAMQWQRERSTTTMHLLTVCVMELLNSMRPSDAYMRR